MKLTTSQKQSLLSLVKDRITSCEDFIVGVNKITQELYHKSNPDDPNTITSFASLNEARDVLRSLKTETAKWAVISKSLKDEIRGNNV